ncbi:potassium channel family protein [Bacillaceae bacterium W0354]
MRGLFVYLLRVVDTMELVERGGRMLYRLWRSYFQIPLILRLLLTVLFFMTLFGFLIYLVEPEQYKSIFNGIWWAFITGSTVGYGDLVPQTLLGKVIGILLILVGGGVLTFYMVTIASGTVEMKKDYEEGKMAYYHKGHYIIVGWNERTRRLIEIIQQEFKNEAKIVLIDETLFQDPLKLKSVHFIKGDPSIDQTWEKANINGAKKIIITADQSMNEKAADRHSILLTITARGIHESIPIIVEILTKDQVINAQRAGATDVISTNESTSTLFFHELIGEQHSQTFDYVMALLSQQRFSIVKVKEEWVDQSILNITYQFKKDGRLLLGFIRNYNININPAPEVLIKKDDYLILTNPLL